MEEKKERHLLIVSNSRSHSITTELVIYVMKDVELKILYLYKTDLIELNIEFHKFQ